MYLNFIKKKYIYVDCIFHSKLLLEVLTDGLPKALKQLVVLNGPKTTYELEDQVHTLSKM